MTYRTEFSDFPETRFHQIAELQGIPLRSLADVQAALAHARTLEAGTAEAMARLMLRHGRLTEEARAYVAQYGAA